MENILKNRRSELGLTLEEVGNKVGVGKSTVRKWEQGMIENMGRDKIVSLSKALQISPIDILGIEIPETFSSIYNQLNEPNQQKVYNFAEYRLKRQNELKENNVHYLLDYGAVSAGTGELLQEENPIEVEYIGEVPQHDFTVTVSGKSMQPMLQHGERLFIATTKEARIGQIVIVNVNNESFVKKLGEDRLISLNEDYDDIYIEEHDKVDIIGVVVL